MTYTTIQSRRPVERNVQGKKRPRNESSRERNIQGTKRPLRTGNETSWERKIHKNMCTNIQYIYTNIQTGVSWALLVYMQNCQPTLLVLIDCKVKLVDLFKTMELLNNRYAFYMLERGREPLPRLHPYRLTHFAL